MPTVRMMVGEQPVESMWDDVEFEVGWTEGDRRRLRLRERLRRAALAVLRRHGFQRSGHGRVAGDGLGRLEDLGCRCRTRLPGLACLRGGNRGATPIAVVGPCHPACLPG